MNGYIILKLHKKYFLYYITNRLILMHSLAY